MDVGDILDRLGLHIDGENTHAAQMLYGTKFLPDYQEAHPLRAKPRRTRPASANKGAP